MFLYLHSCRMSSQQLIKAKPVLTSCITHGESNQKATNQYTYAAIHHHKGIEHIRLPLSSCDYTSDTPQYDGTSKRCCIQTLRNFLCC